MIKLRNPVSKLILSGGLGSVISLSYLLSFKLKWPLYIMTLIFCYFRTKYKPRDLLWGPRLTTSPEQKKVEGEIPASPCGSRPAAAARLYRHGRSLSLLAPPGRTLLLKRKSQKV